jgi:AcrR family transcriptional regulator
MMTNDVSERLLKAADSLFSKKLYHEVTTRMLANEADTSAAMIKYYYSGKLGLYEAVLREKLNLVVEIVKQSGDDFLQGKSMSSFHSLLELLYEYREILKLINRVVIYKDGPGYALVKEYWDIERANVKHAHKEAEAAGMSAPNLDPDILRIVGMSLVTYPLLSMDLIESQIGQDNIKDFLSNYADFVNNMYTEAVMKKISG